MAELNVERRKRHVWPWILGLLALVLIIWAIAATNNRDNDVVQTAPVTTSNEAAVDTTPATTPTQDTSTTDTPATTDDTPRR